MGSKGGGSQTQRTEPWAAQSPYLQYGFQQAQNLYNTGGPQYFPGATYTPFSDQTEQGLALMEQRALQGSPVTDAAQGLATDVLNQRPHFPGGLNYLQGGPDLNQFSNFAGVGNDPLANVGDANVAGLGGVGQGMQNQQQAQNFANVGQGPNYAQGQQLAGVGNTPSLNQATQQFTNQLTGVPDASQNALTQTAQGQNLTGNPYLDQQFDIAAQKVTDTFNRDISPGIAAQFSLAGRTGSDAQGDVLGNAAGQVSDSLADLANKIYGGNYQQERDRQLSAAGQLGSLSQNQQGLGLQAAGQGADFYNQGQSQDISRRGLASNIAGQGANLDLGQRGLAADIYGSSQQRDISRRGLESQNLLGQRGQDINAGLGAGQQDISRRGLAGNMFNQQQGNQLTAAGLDLNAYGQQLGQQNVFGGLANSLANQDYNDINQLLGVGGRVEDLSTRALQDQINRFNHYQNLPQQNLANYIAAIQGNYGGTTTGQGSGGNRWTGALGGASAGSAFGPWGALAGGILGLLG